MQYLKELEQSSQDSLQHSQLRESLLNLINQNSSKVDSFLSTFNLTQIQKELFLEILQESQQNSNSSNQNSLQSVSNNSNSNSNSNNISNEEDFFNKTLEYFNEWREEYFKLRSVSPKCIDIAQNLINNLLVKDELYSSGLIEAFQSLPANNNDAFENFKNHVINVLISQLIELIDKELILIKTSSLSFFKKIYLSYEFEKLQKKLGKRDISVLEKLYDKFDESYVFRGENN